MAYLPGETVTRGMVAYLKRAAVSGGIPVKSVALIEPAGRMPRPLFECIERGWIAERRDRANGYSTSGHTLHHVLYGWDITELGLIVLKANSAPKKTD